MFSESAFVLQKLIKTQFKLTQLQSTSSRQAQQSVSNRRIRGLASESVGLDRTLDLTNKIMSVGSAASSQLESQKSRLKNATSNLFQLSITALFGNELVGRIEHTNRRHTIIVAFVISVCLVLTLYSLGFINLLKVMTT